MTDSTVTVAERLLELGVEDALVMEPRESYDDCIVGALERFGMEPIILYDKQKLIEKLIEEGCETYEEALEYYSYNQLGAWVGPKTPGFLVRLADVV